MNARHDDDDDQPTRDEILDRYGWKPGEKEQLAAEMAERQARIKRDETLARCEQRQAARDATGPTDELGRPLNDPRYRLPEVVTKSQAMRAKDEAAATNYWKGYIRDQLDSANMALTKAIAQAIVDEERRCDQADFDLRTIIIDVRDRFDEMETRLLELEARLSKRGPAIKCDGNTRAFDLDRLRGEWRH